MEAHSINRKTFQLTENGKELGRLIYKDFLFLKAQIHLSDSEIYTLAPIGFFGTSIALLQGESEMARLTVSWSGDIVIVFPDGEEYILKLKGVFRKILVLEDKKGKTAIQLDLKFRWKTFCYSYTITHGVESQDKVKDALLILLGIYSANYLMSAMGG